MKQQRGELTERIKETSKLLLGYEITHKELRLMPYVQYTLMNDQKLDSQYMNVDEFNILSDWVNRGFVTSGVTIKLGRPMLSEKLAVTKFFWNCMSELLWLGYVDLDNNE